MTIDGTWKGQTSEVFDGIAKKDWLKFEAVLKTAKKQGYIDAHETVFEGTCKIKIPAYEIEVDSVIYGAVNLNEISFTMQHQQMIFADATGEIRLVDVPHPEVFLKGKLTGNRFFGGWMSYAAFRKIDGFLYEYPKQEGIWWMEKIMTS